MKGAGYAHHSMAASRANRALLKKSDGTYNSFDKSYITDYKTTKSNKKTSYKKATKIQILKIRRELKRKQKELNERKVAAFTFSLFITAIIAYVIFW